MEKISNFFISFIFVFAFLVSCSAAAPLPTNSPLQTSDSKKYFISLKDFTTEEVRGLGFSINKDLTIHVSGVGGGSKSSWKEFWGSKGKLNDMYASGWIINAETRELVWEMTPENTKGKDEKRSCEEDVELKKGSYEVYFSAHGFSSSSAFNYSSFNVDRREGKTSANRFIDKLLGWFDDDYKSMYRQFMDSAKDVWGITLSVPQSDEGAVQLFDAPKKNTNIIFAATGVGDNAYIRKLLKVSKEVTINIYALGEGRGKKEMFDYGWITNIDTRERVWEMSFSNSDYAGGAEKNVKFKGEITLPKGSYELDYITDGSHSRDDWNMKPPYDPFNYGITLSAVNENEKPAVSVTDYSYEKKNILAQIVRVRNDAFEQAGFSLKAESKIHVYAIGESDNQPNKMADYGWIINAKTREHVWDMERSKTTHAGGAAKNRMIDEVITLPKGDYLVFYQTDDSHAYNDWNDDKPFDAESYGITIMGAGENFSMKNVSPYTESESENILAQLIRVRDDKHVRQKFTLEKSMKVRIYAIGEGVGGEMADYGWIENVKTGETVWEMTYRTTAYAGGAKKNRLYDRSVLLEKGEYEVHFQTDGSHAFGDWNDDPPEDRTHWGITIYKE
ncbi:MAG: hypothetical protein PHP42_03290 [Bacteroidota bacterium]|nr:hypothetical protein [Bacteroidota bacterium]